MVDIDTQEIILKEQQRKLKQRESAKAFREAHPDYLRKYHAKPTRCDTCNITMQYSSYLHHLKSNKHLNEVAKLANPIDTSIIPDGKYYCNCCKSLMNHSSKYLHFKSNTHVRNIN